MHHFMGFNTLLCCGVVTTTARPSCVHGLRGAHTRAACVEVDTLGISALASVWSLATEKGLGQCLGQCQGCGCWIPRTLGLRYAHVIDLAPSSAGRGALSLPMSVCVPVKPGQCLTL